LAWFADRGVTVERVLSDNGACYRSLAWRNTCVSLGIPPAIVTMAGSVAVPEFSNAVSNCDALA
jgi:hypothetical protein